MIFLDHGVCIFLDYEQPTNTECKHKDRKCGVSWGGSVSYIVYGEGLTCKHIFL